MLYQFFSAPRIGNFSAGARKSSQNKDGDMAIPTGEPFGQESRDWLRNRCIGKTIRFIVDYEKYQQSGPLTTPNTPAAERSLSLRLFGTGKVVGPGGALAPISLSSSLVAEGLATCMKYRNRDEPRSCEYAQLLITEAEAAVKSKVSCCV